MSLGHSAYITFQIIMSFRKRCHMPFRKLIPPFTLTASIRQRLKLLFYMPSHMINVLPTLKGRASPFVDSKFNVTSSPISTNLRPVLHGLELFRLPHPLHGIMKRRTCTLPCYQMFVKVLHKLQSGFVVKRPQ